MTDDKVKLKNYPSEEVKNFGEDCISFLINASIRNSLGGLGGSKEFNIEDFPEAF